MTTRLSASRRGFLAIAGGAAGAAAFAPRFAAAQPATTPIAEAAPITAAERRRRMDKAQRLMREQGIGALFVEAGSSLLYFTGVSWWRSERLTAALIPAEGDTLIVTPEFEEPSIREMLQVDAEVRIWNEHESPSKLVADWLKEKKLQGKPFAVEETVRFFAVDGVRKAAPGLETISGADIVNACRMQKSQTELALMQRASDITIAAYRDTYRQVEAGMDGDDIFAIMRAAMVKYGGAAPSGGVQINKGSALPHGSKEREKISEGSIILMDCGCGADGYRSDISRTFVYGEPNKMQRRIFQEVRKGQETAMEAAQIGVAAGTVDDKVRALYEKMGYGPGYATPGLPHRTGHGIGLDVHEPINLVHGETTKLAPGMCFSNEPGIYVPGSFGVRTEDCFYMTAEGPKFFTQPPTSLDAPMG